MNKEYLSIETMDEKYVVGKKGVRSINFWAFNGIEDSGITCYFKVVKTNGQEILISNTMPHIATTKPNL